MPPDVRESFTAPEAEWAARQSRWARKLGRLRLGVEPLDEQVARYRRVTWVLTIVAGVVASMFVALFAAFGRPGIGAAIAAILLGPVVAIAWLDFGRLARGASAYEREKREFDRRSGRAVEENSGA